MRRILPKGTLAIAMVALSGTALRVAFAGQDSVSREHPRYSQASLSGSYAFVGTYAANIAANLGVMSFDGIGGVKGVVIVNQPAANGLRTLVRVTVNGTYSVNNDGTGVIAFTVTFADGHTADVTEDFVITHAESRGGVLIATSMFDAQEQPSVVISGNVFVTHTYTRRPD
ncbi:MAG: hypothetical protein JO159_20795 [Acidobacteria bacterium]|nr:hypothetical protein [Acidobacteriota bacterium]